MDFSVDLWHCASTMGEFRSASLRMLHYTTCCSRAVRGRTPIEVAAQASLCHGLWSSVCVVVKTLRVLTAWARSVSQMEAHLRLLRHDPSARPAWSQSTMHF